MTPPSQPDDLKQSRMLTAQPSGQAVALEDFKKRLADEYKMLQDKIDKIGAFRFTIKGWSITVVVAASAAATSTKSLLTVFTISLGVALLLLLFFWMEREQVRLSRLFGDRARRLENALVRLDRDRGKPARLPFPVPFTANEIASASRSARLLHIGRLSQLEGPPPLFRRIAEEWRVCRRAHIWFYTFLLCLAFAPLIPRYADIYEHWNRWTKHVVSAPAQPPGTTGAAKRP